MYLYGGPLLSNRALRFMRRKFDGDEPFMTWVQRSILPEGQAHSGFRYHLLRSNETETHNTHLVLDSRLNSLPRRFLVTRKESGFASFKSFAQITIFHEDERKGMERGSVHDKSKECLFIWSVDVACIKVWFEIIYGQ